MLAVLFGVLVLASDTVGTTPSEPQAPSANAAAKAPATPKTPAATETAEQPKKICKMQPPMTGQVRAKRICMTAEQWKALK